MSKFYTVKEAAELMGIKPDTLYNKKEQIGYYQPGKKVLFAVKDIDNFIQKSYKKPE